MHHYNKESPAPEAEKLWYALPPLKSPTTSLPRKADVPYALLASYAGSAAGAAMRPVSKGGLAKHRTVFPLRRPGFHRCAHSAFLAGEAKTRMLRQTQHKSPARAEHFRYPPQDPSKISVRIKFATRSTPWGSHLTAQKHLQWL